MLYDLSNKHDRETFLSRSKELSETGEIVELRIKRKKRTIQQNKYLHVCISLFAIEFGYTLEESKTMLKRNCHFMTYTKKGHKFLKRTSQMDTSELTQFIEWVRDFSANHGYYIPSSEEYLFNSVFYDKEIEKNKQYL